MQHSEIYEWRIRLWHFQICLDGTKKQRKLRLQHVVQPAERGISRKKSLQPVELPAVLAISNLFCLDTSTARRRSLRRESKMMTAWAKDNFFAGFFYKNLS